MSNGTKGMNDFRDDDDARFLIVKRGLYYRPNAAGYTGVKAEAGRYTEDGARSSSHPNGPSGSRDGMSYVHEDEAPDYSPSCCIHAKADHQNTRIAALEAEVAQARDRALVEAAGVIPEKPGGLDFGATANAIRRDILALRSTSPAPSEAVPDVCDGKEQHAFEAWAAREEYDMSQHPLHWLFLDSRTHAARDGWRAAIAYCRRALASEGDAP